MTETKVREYDLKDIFAVFTDFNERDFTPNPVYMNGVFELVKFVFDVEVVNWECVNKMRDRLKKHILNIHPELRNFVYKQRSGVDNFLLDVQEKLGKEYLPITKIGEKLPLIYRQTQVGNARKKGPVRSKTRTSKK